MSVLFDLSQFNVRLRRSTPTQHVENVQIERPNGKYAENCVTLLNAIRPFENLISRIILKCNALLSLNRLQNHLNRTSENGTLKKLLFRIIIQEFRLPRIIIFDRFQILRYRRDIPMY